MSYILVLAPLLAASIVAAVLALRRDRRRWGALAIAAAIVLALTIVFDSLMIAADLFRYDDGKLLGPRVGLAPVEDLGYALIAVLLAAAIWTLLPSRVARGRDGAPAAPASEATDA
ncbi:lycopene cyclase domain-containing protein [Agrococcus lahaulensis]|uniref:lycopene cyclase domain-containing protein n=1 Tax=Agrococcus lahaulensis TaxID=341722 RepID=UPI0006843F0C|nr:lycopene cyclase domain-containing protein [Agrococcus lahaulensis]